MRLKNIATQYWQTMGLTGQKMVGSVLEVHVF